MIGECNHIVHSFRDEMREFSRLFPARPAMITRAGVQSGVAGPDPPGSRPVTLLLWPSGMELRDSAGPHFKF